MANTIIEQVTDEGQSTLPGFSAALAHRKRKAVGTIGESIASRMLEASGYRVSHCQAGEQRGDLRAVDISTGETFQIEVKTARRGRDNKWRFKLYKAGCTDHRHSDYVILLAALDSGRVVPFLIPIAVLSDQKQAVICSHPERYDGKLAVYRCVGRLVL